MNGRLIQRYKINMNLAKEIARLSTCDRANVGAVIYNPSNHKIEGMGYNGSLPGHPHCDDVGHLLVENHCVRTRHAEQNAIKQSQITKDCILFVTHFPCINCTKELIDAGIKEVIYLEGYRMAPEAIEMLNFAKIKYSQYEKAFSEV